jgi:ribosomal protein S18 acetylase RimI-like enzyme
MLKRMTSRIAAFERMSAQHWQGTESRMLGDWMLRAAAGFTRRANSALAVGSPTMPLPQAVAEVEAWYRDRGLPPMIELATALDADSDGGELGRLLTELGWLSTEPMVVMTADAQDVARYQRDEQQLRLADEPDELWLDLYNFDDRALPQVARQVLMSAPRQQFASVLRAGKAVAIGRLSLVGGWAGLTAVEVAEDCRRQGLGTAVTAGLAGTAIRCGATRIFLQVRERNSGARAMYAKCGFTDRHRYHFRQAQV